MSHDIDLNCVFRDLRCQKKKYLGIEVFLCYCYGPVRVSRDKFKNECRKDDVLKLCLKKRRKEKLKTMGGSAKVALLGWMIVMVRKFKMGNAPVDWERKMLTFTWKSWWRCGNTLDLKERRISPTKP